MPDSAWETTSFADAGPNVARIIRNGETTLTLLVRFDRERSCYVVWEEGSDETLEYSGVIDVIYRLADMYLEGFRKGYDRGYYDACIAELRDYALREKPEHGYINQRAAADTTRHLVYGEPPSYCPVEGDGGNRVDDQGSAEGDRPDRR